MFSGEGEMVPFCEVLYPTGNVEDWLLEVERVMRLSLKRIIEESLKDYKEVYMLDCMSLMLIHTQYIKIQTFGQLCLFGMYIRSP